jgi:peroxiredoxin
MAPDFALVKSDLGMLRLSDLRGKKVVLSISPAPIPQFAQPQCVNLTSLQPERKMRLSLQ